MSVNKRLAVFQYWFKWSGHWLYVDEELILSLDVAAECAEELRLPPPLDPEQQRAADIEYRREADADARRQGFV